MPETNFSDGVPTRITYLGCERVCAAAGRVRTELNIDTAKTGATAIARCASPPREADEVMNSSIRRTVRSGFGSATKVAFANNHSAAVFRAALRATSFRA